MCSEGSRGAGVLRIGGFGPFLPLTPTLETAAPSVALLALALFTVGSLGVVWAWEVLKLLKREGAFVQSHERPALTVPQTGWNKGVNGRQTESNQTKQSDPTVVGQFGWSAGVVVWTSPSILSISSGCPDSLSEVLADWSRCWEP